MKLRNSLLAAALAVVVAPAAMAQSTGDVSITGSLVPGSCDITLSNGGVVDAGSIDYATLVQSGSKKMPGIQLTSSFVCSGPTLFAVTITDNNRTTLTPGDTNNNNLGLGLTAGGNEIGYFDFWHVSSIKDGVASTIIKSADLITWSAGTGHWQVANGLASPTKYRAFGTAATGPVAITTGSFTDEITPFIRGRNQLALTQDASLDGSATYEITYL